MKSRWKSLQPLQPDQTYLVLASSIPPRSMSSTMALFRGSRAVRKQLARTAGVIGYSLLAEPFRKHYATLSVWRDEDALHAFAISEPHRRFVEELGSAMDTTQFERWTISGADGLPTWSDALERLR
jgi:heme-degrading monooxygenase HmoA